MTLFHECNECRTCYKCMQNSCFGQLNPPVEENGYVVKRCQHCNEIIEKYQVMSKNTALDLAKFVVEILDNKAHAGCKDKSWDDFQNGFGEYLGKDIEQIISEAKKIISENENLK